MYEDHDRPWESVVAAKGESVKVESVPKSIPQDARDAIIASGHIRRHIEMRKMSVGYIGLDLGVTTGMAWGIYSPALRDEVGLWMALARGRMTGYDQIYSEDITAAGLVVATKVGNLIAEFNVMRGMPRSNVRVCIEDFQARPQSVRGGKAKDKLAPVFLAGLVAGSLSAAGWGPCIRMYDPSLTKSKANDKRLKEWGRLTRPRNKMGWIVGKQHARDACRLIAVGLEREV
jgi:hypothetical protein